ncbi:cAMP-dependent protein kinase type II regulatory subunit [Elysia marginata]|uniref:cAMP-dependent protein kinase type II regulatory subunit n=1 Tax=Elysia marginata TaxID=1093978 RepID=A0AAV4G9X8_9GAST|nr:cAMP-dependent protein kinase type II regulatory subunit [Elysia marginata]
MNFEIPPGLTDLLQEFTVAVLRSRPSNLESFAADYFNNLNQKVNGVPKIGLRFQEGVYVKDEHDHSHSGTDDEEEFAPPPSRDRRKSVSAERYDPEADDDQDYVKLSKRTTARTAWDNLCPDRALWSRWIAGRQAELTTAMTCSYCVRCYYAGHLKPLLSRSEDRHASELYGKKKSLFKLK